MAREIIIVLNTHRKFGELLVPYLIERRPGQTFFQLNEVITSENLNQANVTINSSTQKIIELSNEYSDKCIFRFFSKKKNLKEFMESIDENQIRDQIRPYIEKRLENILTLLPASNIRIFKKVRNYQVVHDEEQLFFTNEKAQAVFNFIKNELEFKYFLSIRSNGKDIKLLNQPYVCICQKPCIVLIKNKIFEVENIDSKKIAPFFLKDFISIPKNTEKEYLETFVKKAILNYPVKAQGFTIAEETTTRKAILKLEKDLNGFPVIELILNYGNSTFNFFDELKSDITLTIRNNHYVFCKTSRDFEWENSLMETLNQLNFSKKDYKWLNICTINNTDPILTLFEYINFFNANNIKLNQLGFDISTARFDKEYYLESINLDIDLKKTADWFDIKANVLFDQFQIPFVRLRKHILMGIREFTLPNGKIAIIPLEWYSRFTEFFQFADENEDHFRLRKHHIQILHETIGEDRINQISQLSNKLNPAQIEAFPVPLGLNATLREYQKTGYYWMYQLYKNKMGGCLADDMGLGKTVQTLSLLLKIKEETPNAEIPKKRKPNTNTLQLSLFSSHPTEPTMVTLTSLIVMPVSLIHNWEREITRFAPALKIYKFFGTQRTRNIADFTNADIVLTSYGVVRNEIDNLKNFHFNYIILDESQMIKNPDSKIYKSVIQLNSDNKLVLTGTPIENSLTDLWAQLNFVNRGLLNSSHYFKESFATPIEKMGDEKKQKKLQLIINPFILRRKKGDVAKELPSLTEQVLYCEMTDQQKSIYEAEKSKIRNQILDNIERQGIAKSSIVILKGLNMLRMLANHPVMQGHDESAGSGKFEEICRNIENLIDEQHKVLVFSSYVKHLNLVANYLNNRNEQYSILTGATKDRALAIEKFTNNPDNRVFLISLKAGGTGLNLTAADYVFILDPWWNPASENQAVSRAYRIGQDKKVFCYRFISKDTIEEKIQLLQERKSALADLFINQNNPFKTFTSEEIKGLFD